MGAHEGADDAGFVSALELTYSVKQSKFTGNIKTITTLDLNGC